MALNQEDLNKFRVQRERLGEMLSEASGVIQELNMTSAGENLAKLGEKVNNGTFKIQVIGTFKNGKSTFINSLLGEAVLPAYARPTTAVINEVKYGEDKQAVLHFRNPLPERLPSLIPSRAMHHMQEHGMRDIPPLHIDYNEIEDYVVIPMGEDPTEMLLESPYEKVELFWPLPLLKEGVEIIDSPGLNEAETRTRVTMDYLANADAIIFVLDSTHLCAKDEMHFIEDNLRANGFTEPFFVVNRFDCILDREKDDIRKLAHVKLGEYTTNEIFFVSALQALEGELESNENKYNQSGMTAFTDRLTDFLTKDKGKIKLSQPARELKRILNNEALYKVIPGQRSMLESSLDDVKARYEAAKPQLETLKSKKDQIVSKLLLRIEQSKHEFRRAANRNTLSIAGMIPGWVEAYTPKKGISGFFSPNKKDIQEVVQEISSHIQQKVEETQSTWKKDVLVPLAEERTHYIFDSAEQDISNLLNEIDNISIQISGDNYTAPAKEISGWERIAGAVGGLLGGGIGGALTGGATGLSKELAKTVAVNFGGAMLLSLLGWLNPYTAVALLAATIFTGVIGVEEKTIKQVKKRVSESIVDQLSKSSDEESAKVANSIASQLEKVANGVSVALDNEISQVSTQVNSIIDEMKKGQTNIDARKKVINTCEAKIKALSTDLDAFTFELIEQ